MYEGLMAPDYEGATLRRDEEVGSDDAAAWTWEDSARTSQENSAVHTSSAPMVLYIADDLTNIALISRLFSRWPEVRVVGAMQGTLGLELARAHQPALIVVALPLPDLRGVQILRRLAEVPRTRSTPTVILSADTHTPQADDLLDAGAYAYLAGPIDVREFLRVVATVLPEPLKR